MPEIFACTYTWQQLWTFYNFKDGLPSSDLLVRFNVRPTTTINSVISESGERRLQPMRWGLIPSWWSKSPKGLTTTFNAHVEKIESNPMFRSAWNAKRRCIIPVSGYYELQTVPGESPRPWYFSLGDGSPIMSVAGIWSDWRHKQTGEKLKSCAMIITKPNKFVAESHDRMPVLLQPEQFEPWLSGDAGMETLVSAPEDMLQKWPVSKRVNSSRTSDEDSTLTDKVTL